MKKVVLITSGQPSTNPRLKKEADSLSKAGYDVTVIYQYWTAWATDADNITLPKVNWKGILVGGNPEKRLIFLLTKILHNFFKLLSKFIGLRFGIAERTICRSYDFLLYKAYRNRADIYIAHNLGALPIAVKCAKKYNTQCGFDAEDFHRFESSNDTTRKEFKTIKFIEDKYIPSLNYITAASPLIAEEYERLYGRKNITSILNVFERTRIINQPKRPGLNLFWFSQTIGKDRGIEEVIDAMGSLAKKDIFLHLLGQSRNDIEFFFIEYCKNRGLLLNQISFYNPINPEEIFQFAANFDIGLATETGIPHNRDICLTNKIFTYIQSGLAIVASDTKAQEILLGQFKYSGKIYKKADVTSLAEALLCYYNSSELLEDTKRLNFRLGQDTLNWDVESAKFLKVVQSSIG